jgi:hypothetical protein
MRYAVCALVLVIAAALGGCPKASSIKASSIRKGRSRRRSDFLINRRHHARRRDTGDRGHVGVRWWYRSSNTRAGRGGRGFEGRIEFVVWSIPA